VLSEISLSLVFKTYNLQVTGRFNAWNEERKLANDFENYQNNIMRLEDSQKVADEVRDYPFMR